MRILESLEWAFENPVDIKNMTMHEKVWMYERCREFDRYKLIESQIACVHCNYCPDIRLTIKSDGEYCIGCFYEAQARLNSVIFLD